MLRLRREKPEKVVAEVVAAGAPADVAHAIVDALLEAGLSAGEAREWLFHENRAYGHDWPYEMLGETMTLKAGSRFVIEQGRADTVLDAAREFAAASEDERAIVQLFGGNVADTRRLTGSDPGRAAAIAGIARAIELQEDAVRDELARGELDPKALLRSGELNFIGW